MEIEERDGPRGGQYFTVGLPDGREMSVSRNLDDRRIWLGRPGEFHNQRGGVGVPLDKYVDELRSRIALDDEAQMLYEAARALQQRRSAV